MKSGSELSDGRRFEGAHRSDWLRAKATGLARAGLSGQAISAALSSENAARCEPPLDDGPVQGMARDALWWEIHEASERESTFQRFDDRLLVVTDQELDNMPAPGWLIEGLIPKEAVILVYGEPGIGKSFLALDWIACVKAGFSWQGRKVEQGNVVYVAGEGVGGLSARVRAWKKTHDVSGALGMNFLTGPLDLLDEHRVDEFIERFARSTPAIVVLDTLARCLIGNEDSAQDMGSFISGADRIRRALKCSVVILHHPTKNGSGERGSGALRGAVDTAVRLSEEMGAIKLAVDKQKDAPPPEYTWLRLQPVDLENGESSCVVCESMPKLSTAQPRAGRRTAAEQVLDLLRTEQAGLKSADVKVRLPRIGASTVYKAIKQLRDLGVIEHTEGDLYKIAGSIQVSSESGE